MQPVITLDGVQLHPLNDDGTGFGIDHDKFSGWYGSPSPRAAYTDKTSAPGSYFSPAFRDKRVVSLGGKVLGGDRRGLILLQRSLSRICPDPYSLYELRVTDELGTLVAMVQRSSEVLFSPVSDTIEAWSIQVTAPDPRLLDPAVQSVSTQLAQPGAGGIEWNGIGGASNLITNGTFETTVSPWTVVDATLAQSPSGQGHTGSYSAMMTPSGAVGSTPQITSPNVAATPGVTYTAAAWVKATAGSSGFSPAIVFLNSSGTSVGGSPDNPEMATAGVWERHAVSATAPAGTTQVLFRMYIAGAPPASSVFYIDDVTLVATGVTGTAWRGPAGTTGLVMGAPTSTGVVTADNTEGSDEADLTFTVAGPASHPRISSAVGILEYGDDLGSDDVLVINTGAESVLLNGSDRRYLMTTDQFFKVPAGESLDIRFTAALENDSALLTAQWQVSQI